MRINNVEIADTFAEVFPVCLSRLLISGRTRDWALRAAQNAVGFATSFITCSAQGGIEGPEPAEVPDKRPGVAIQIGVMNKKLLTEQLLLRIGGCVMTCPTTSVFDFMPKEERKGFVHVGKKIGFFGDGYQRLVKKYEKELVSIPRMEGDFLVEKSFGYTEGVADDFFIMADSQHSALKAAEVVISSINKIEGVVAPFPGGICASGSKVGSLNYDFLRASTNHRYCPTIASKIEGSKLPKNVKSVYEIVIMGLNVDRVKYALKVGIESATEIQGVIKIDAWNEGGKFGKYKFYLHEILGKE